MIGLLLAPKTGKETREQLFGGAASTSRSRLKDAVGAGKESAADQNETLRRKIEETRERLREQMDARNGVGARTPTAAPPARRRATPAEPLARNGLRAAAALGGAAALGLSYLLLEAQWVRRVDRRLPAPDAGAASTASPSCSSPTSTSGSCRASTCAPRARPSTWRWRRAPTSSSSPVTSPAARAARRAPRGSSCASRAPLGVFAVLGNHDHGDSKAPFVRPTDPRLVDELRACGCSPTSRRRVDARRGGGAGRRRRRHRRRPRRPAGGPGAARPPPGVLRLLLTHLGEVVSDARPGDFPLTFAGDTHGGQICLPLPGRRIMLSDLRAEFAEGAYDVGGRPLYVTRGVGHEPAAVPRVLPARGRRVPRGGRRMRPAARAARRRRARGAAPLALCSLLVAARRAAPPAAATPIRSPASYWEPSTGRRVRDPQGRRRLRALLRRRQAAVPGHARAATSSASPTRWAARPSCGSATDEGTLELETGGQDDAARAAAAAPVARRAARGLRRVRRVSARENRRTSAGDTLSMAAVGQTSVQA